MTLGLPELLPCPFCGGTADFVDTESDETRRAMLGVECGSCGADIITFPESYAAQPKHGILKDSARAWNRRTALPEQEPATEAMAARLRGAIVSASGSWHPSIDQCRELLASLKDGN